MNTRIRNNILAYLANNGATDTRVIIRNMAASYHTTKQRISGNISYMVKSGMVSINRNYPHSTIY